MSTSVQILKNKLKNYKVKDVDYLPSMWWSQRWKRDSISTILLDMMDDGMKRTPRMRIDKVKKVFQSKGMDFKPQQKLFDSGKMATDGKYIFPTLFGRAVALTNVLKFPHLGTTATFLSVYFKTKRVGYYIRSIAEMRMLYGYVFSPRAFERFFSHLITQRYVVKDYETVKTWHIPAEKMNEFKKYDKLLTSLYVKTVPGMSYNTTKCGSKGMNNE